MQTYPGSPAQAMGQAICSVAKLTSDSLTSITSETDGMPVDKL
jgi:hypothetical protein